MSKKTNHIHKTRNEHTL